ncbi:MAG: YebC/PmpR family DNA-binding transcriptional regulator [Gammaproteobacteria bacterium]|nr:YebC/PmpR family DNA-binding transcriptional regulator [Gammaproteobacteria bacterium]
MAGHSKWANIKHRKARQDAKRGKVFTKLIRAITVAARAGGDDLSSNSTLRLAIDKALAENMPRDTIDRAIKRGAGGAEGANVSESFYEGYGPAGVAILVECLTDNKNRTVSEVRHAFTKAGGNLGTDGSVAYLFTKKGVFTFPPESDEDSIMEIALENGADDIVNNEDGSLDLFTDQENYQAVKDALEKANIEIANADLGMVPSMQATLDQDAAEKVLRLIDVLEDLDDVQNVYHNADIPDEVLESL